MVNKYPAPKGQSKVYTQAPGKAHNKLYGFHRPQAPSIAIGVDITKVECMPWGKRIARDTLGTMPMKRDRKSRPI